MPSVSTCLWFDGRVEEAADFYVSIVPGSQIVRVDRYPDGVEFPGGARPGDALQVLLELAGQSYALLNGGPVFPQSESCSIVVVCDDQAEVDRLWGALTADGGQESQCGWLKDRFGVSWQVFSHEIDEILRDPDPERAARANAAMLQMQRLDADALRAAADGRPWEARS